MTPEKPHPRLPASFDLSALPTLLCFKIDCVRQQVALRGVVFRILSGIGSQTAQMVVEDLRRHILMHAADPEIFVHATCAQARA